MGGIWWWTWPDGKVKVIFCDVGQGDGTLIIQGNFQMLIDTGPENKRILRCLEKHLPFWDKKIEVVVITHLDSDHSGGLKEIKDYYNVQKIYSPGLSKGDVINYKSIVYEVISPGEDWGEANKNSIVGVLGVNEKKFLMLGDIDSEVEQKLVWRKELEKVDVLKVSHHGSAEATSQELLEVVRPDEAIISVGKGNRFGHPTKIVLERLVNIGVKIWRTDEQEERVFIL